MPKAKQARIYGKNIYSDEGSASDLIYILSGGKVPIRKKTDTVATTLTALLQIKNGGIYAIIKNKN